MKFKYGWCGFFTAMAGVTATGLTLTALLAKNTCSAFAGDIVSMARSVLGTEISIDGSLKTNITLGDEDFSLPIAADDLQLSFMLGSNERLIAAIRSKIANGIETGCNAMVWQAGVQDILLLLLVMAAACGIVIAFKSSQKEERVDLEDALNFSPV